MARDIRTMNMTSGQQIESDDVMKRLGTLEFRNLGGVARAGLFDQGKALITSGLRVVADTGMTVLVPTGSIFQKQIDVTGCLQISDQSVTLDAASGSPRIDMVECQIKSVVDKTDYARIGTVATGTGGGSVIITNEEIKRDVKYYVAVQKKTGTTTPTSATAGELTGTVDISSTIDLSDYYLINISDGEDGNWQEVDCRGTNPVATSRTEIINAINAAVGRTMASAGSGGVVVLTGSGTGEGSYFSIKPPVTDADKDALETIFGVSAGGVYKYEWRGVNGWIKLCEIDVGASTTTITDSLIRNIDQKDTWASETDEVIVKSHVYGLNGPDWNEWSSLRTYAAGEIAYLGDMQFVSLVGSNLNKDPLFETDYWVPSPSLNDALDTFHKGLPLRGGFHPIHDPNDGDFQQWYIAGKYRLGSRTLIAYAVHMDGTTVTGDTDLESIFTGYHLVDIVAPDSMGTRTIVDFKDRTNAVVAGSGTLGEIREDRMQGWQSGSYADVSGSRMYYGYINTRDYQANYNAPASGYGWNLYATSGAQGAANKITAVNDGTNGTPRTGKTTEMKSWREGVPYILVVKSI